MADTQWTEVSSPAYMAGNQWVATAGLPAPDGALDPYACALRAWTTPEPPDPLNAVVAQRNTQAEFSPAPAGETLTVSGLLFRSSGVGARNFSVFLFAALPTDDVTDSGYLLGLSAGLPGHITLARASLEAGLPLVEDDATGSPPAFPWAYTGGSVLARSTTTVPTEEWVHLQLEVEPDGADVNLTVWRNDLTTNTMHRPVWEPVPGMDTTVDVGGLVAGGHAGFATQYAASGVVGAVDHIVLGRSIA